MKKLLTLLFLSFLSISLIAEVPASTSPVTYVDYPAQYQGQQNNDWMIHKILENTENTKSWVHFIGVYTAVMVGFFTIGLISAIAAN